MLVVHLLGTRSCLFRFVVLQIVKQIFRGVGAGSGRGMMCMEVGFVGNLTVLELHQ